MPVSVYGTVLRRHLGTVAFGALVHTFTDGPHRALATLERSAMAHATVGGDGSFKKGRTGFQALSSAVVNCISKGSCGLVEGILKYTSANAYTSVAMFGTGYWASAKSSFYLIIRNKDRLGATMSVAQIIPFIAKVSATVMTTSVFYFIQVGRQLGLIVCVRLFPTLLRLECFGCPTGMGLPRLRDQHGVLDAAVLRHVLDHHVAVPGAPHAGALHPSAVLHDRRGVLRPRRAESLRGEGDAHLGRHLRRRARLVHGCPPRIAALKCRTERMR